MRSAQLLRTVEACPAIGPVWRTTADMGFARVPWTAETCPTIGPALRSTAAGDGPPAPNCGTCPTIGPVGRITAGAPWPELWSLSDCRTDLESSGCGPQPRLERRDLSGNRTALDGDGWWGAASLLGRWKACRTVGPVSGTGAGGLGCSVRAAWRPVGQSGRFRRTSVGGAPGPGPWSLSDCRTGFGKPRPAVARPLVACGMDI